MASAAPGPTSAADTATSVMPEAIDAANDQRCSQPRIRGLTSGAGFGGAIPAVTPRGYGTVATAWAVHG